MCKYYTMGEQRITAAGHRNPLRPFLAEYLVERFQCAEMVRLAHFQAIVSYNALRAGVMATKVRDDAHILSGICVYATHRHNRFFTFHLVHLFHCPILNISARPITPARYVLSIVAAIFSSFVIPLTLQVSDRGIPICSP